MDEHAAGAARAGLKPAPTVVGDRSELVGTNESAAGEPRHLTHHVGAGFKPARPTAGAKRQSLPQRKPLRLPHYDYATPGAYFITVCSHRHACLFGAVVDDVMRPNALGRAVAECWRELPAHYPGLVLDAFVVMPNHVHGLVFLEGKAALPYGLGEIVRAFKTFSGREINKLRRTPGRPVWQRGFYEHIVPRDESLDAIRAYIAHNPLRWALHRENPVNAGVAAKAARAGFKPAPTAVGDGSGLATANESAAGEPRPSEPNVGAGFKPARAAAGAAPAAERKAAGPGGPPW